ncbi:MAG TPA: polysaccharide deacetylase family protein [Tissierellia bacterium]|nr:polysaccharide deacetylase family protein [Tissierellia bacterium]
MRKLVALVLMILFLVSCSPSAEKVSADWTERQNELRESINRIELLKGELPGAWSGDLLPEDGLEKLMAKDSRIQQNHQQRADLIKEASKIADKLTALDREKLSEDQNRLTDQLVEYLRLESLGLDQERAFFNGLVSDEPDEVLGDLFQAVIANRQLQRDVIAGVVAVSTPLPNEPTEEEAEPTETPEVELTPPPVAETPTEPAPPVAAGYRLNQATQLFEPLSESDPMAVLLTFDDVPMTEGAKESIAIAKTLKEQNIPAIFFVFGNYLHEAIGQETIIELHEMGFALGNHAQTHQDLSAMSEEMVRQELQFVNDEIEALVGERPKFFRPPFGMTNDTVNRIAREEGMLPMNWTYGYDWEEEYKDDSAALAQIMVETPYLTPGANLLMHDRAVTAGAIGQIVEGLQAKGYHFIDPAEIDLTGQDIIQSQSGAADHE